MKFSWDLYLAVIVANIAGYLEADDVIEVPDDEELTDTVCDIVNEFQNDSLLQETSDMFEYAEKRLVEIYGYKEDDDNE